MEDLRSNNKLFEAIFDYATMGIMVTNQKGEIILINQFALDEFLYNEKEIIGQRIETLIPSRYHRQHTNERHSYYHHAESRAMGAGRNLFGLRKDGSEFPVEVSLSPFDTEEGTFVMAFIINITLRKEKEIKVLAYQDQITEIQDSLKKEKELGDMKSRFVSMASHEFKTPLSTILSSASLLSKYTETDQQDKRDKHIDRIKSSVGNLNSILNEFLSIGKIENGQIGIHHIEFAIDIFISAIIIELEDIKKPQQEISYQHIGDKMTFLDRDLLRNIISNLLSNAIKFSKDDGRISIITNNTPESLNITIKDNGYGISKEDQAHLFERFYRGNNVLTIRGTGLGLHIVSKYVELMKGEINIKSELNKGTEVNLKFQK